MNRGDPWTVPSARTALEPQGVGALDREEAVDDAEVSGSLGDVGNVRRKRKHLARSFWAELPILILVALVVAVLIKTFLVQAFYIPSLSMVPVLEVGDRVLVSKLSYTIGEVDRGDVVVFDSPFAPDESQESLVAAVVRNVSESLGLQVAEAKDFIKRIVALPGETIEVRDGVVLIDGAPLDEPYLSATTVTTDHPPEVVPAGFVFVMGDNRTRSQDSRKFGPIGIDTVVGEAVVRVWPLDRFGGLDGQESAVSADTGQGRGD